MRAEDPTRIFRPHHVRYTHDYLEHTPTRNRYGSSHHSRAGSHGRCRQSVRESAAWSRPSRGDENALSECESDGMDGRAFGSEPRETRAAARRRAGSAVADLVQARRSSSPRGRVSALAEIRSAWETAGRALRTRLSGMADGDLQAD